MEYLQLIGGIAILLYSGKYLVDGGVSLAKHFNIPTLIIGITVIAFGTSAPELIVSANAAISGHPEIAVGNVVGSNIANIALILALTSIIMPIPVNPVSLKVDWPVMMAAFLLLFLFILDDNIQRWESAVLFASLVAYMGFSIWYSRRSGEPVDLAAEVDPSERPQFSLWVSILIAVAASAGLAIGAKFMVDGASTIATSLGVSERIISITVVAFGTSVPELTASIIAAMKRQTDIAVGNIIGSNIFNVFAVIGISGMITPIAVDHDIFGFDMLAMIVISIFLFLFIFPFQTVYLKRWEGTALLGLYGLYMWMIFTGNVFQLPV